MASNEDWTNNADTHKMSSEEIKRAGVDGSKRPPGSTLHQRRSLSYSPYTMAAAGLAMVGGLWYFTVYTKIKPEASARDVARVSAGVADPQDTHPRK